MKYEYEDLPNFVLGHDGYWQVYSYSRVLVPIPENDNDVEVLEE